MESFNVGQLNFRVYPQSSWPKQKFIRNPGEQNQIQSILIFGRTLNSRYFTHVALKQRYQLHLTKPKSIRTRRDRMHLIQEFGIIQVYLSQITMMLLVFKLIEHRYRHAWALSTDLNFT